MVRKKAGRPESRPSHLDPQGMDLERRGIVLHKSVRYSDLTSGARDSLATPLGIYGRTRYGRCRYGSRRGIYGADRYGSAIYH